ncbi:MAG: PorP/SprF family type IX secretion system membrane protein [Bacteroidetes bacterium]|nr:PorP/SprF family type IX secretion system membrane protein [Bacteroidota bacterium]
MKHLKLHIASVLIIIGMGVSAQQFPHRTQYLINPYSLTPTLAGLTGYSELFLDYRNDWTRINGSPRTFSANGFGNIYQQKVWLGGEAVMDKTDILSTFKLNASFTYKLQVEDNQYLFFSAWGTFFQASVNTGNSIGVDPNDPLLNNLSKLNSSAFNAGFGINYNRDRFNLGISIPTLFGSDDTYDGSTYKFKVQREVMFFSSYLFDLGESWQMQAFGVFRKTTNEPSVVEISTLFIFRQQFWGGLLYRTGGALALNVGAHISRGFVFNYAYEIGMSGINQGSGGSHEISIGYRFYFDDLNYFDKKSSKYSRKTRSDKPKRTKKVRGRSYRQVAYPQINDYNYRGR